MKAPAWANYSTNNLPTSVLELSLPVPELPEVQSIINRLSRVEGEFPFLFGQTISGFTLFWPKTLAIPTVEELEAALPGRTIRDLTRRGKFLILVLDQGNLVFHLRMSGDLYLQPGLAASRTSDPIQPHDRFYLHLRSGYTLVFNDARKFGRVWYTGDLSLLFDKLGPEPLGTELNAEKFYAMLHQRNRQLKPLLMDQSFLAGLGNIYTDEALFEAGLNPRRRSGSLTHQQAGLLLDSIRKVLRRGIEHNGASIDWVYRGGKFQNFFNVYQQTGNPCPRCGTPIIRTTVGQRGTHYCPSCQPDPEVDDV